MYRPQRVFGQRRKVCCGRIGARLLGRLCAGDDRRDGFEAEDPAQRELSQRHALGHELAQLLHDLEPALEVDAGERLAHVESLTVAVEGPVVVCCEACVSTELAGQQTRGERNADDHADVAQAGALEEELGRSLTEDVEDDLHRCDAWILDRLQRLLNLLDADPIRADEPFLHESVAGLEHRGCVVRLPRWAVQLNEIDRVDVEVLA